MIPTKIGLKEMNPKYITTIKSILSLKWSVGIVGGQPRSSFYFLGHQGDNIFYLDPHTTQQYVPWDQATAAKSATYHYNGVNSIPCEKLDPSMALGFYCRDEKDFNDFWIAAKKHASEDYCMFTVADRTPSYIGELLMSSQDDEKQDPPPKDETPIDDDWQLI